MCQRSNPYITSMNENKVKQQIAMSSDVCFSEKTRRGVRVYGISRELRRIMQIWKGQPAFPIRPGVLKSPIKITRLFLVSSSFPKKKNKKKICYSIWRSIKREIMVAGQQIFTIKCEKFNRNALLVKL